MLGADLLKYGYGIPKYNTKILNWHYFTFFSMASDVASAAQAAAAAAAVAASSSAVSRSSTASREPSVGDHQLQSKAYLSPSDT